MKKLLIIPLLILGLISCKKDHPELKYECLNQFGQFEPNEKPYNGNSDHVFFYNKKLLIQEDDDNVYMDLEDGTNVVFKYEFNKNDNPLIADDEYGEAIYFEIDPELESFHVEDNDLDAMKTIFGKFCFCVDGGYHKVDTGCIHGEKISRKTWKISFSLRINSTYEPLTIMVDKEFSHRD